MPGPNLPGHIPLTLTVFCAEAHKEKIESCRRGDEAFAEALRGRQAYDTQGHSEYDTDDNPINELVRPLAHHLHSGRAPHMTLRHITTQCTLLTLLSTDFWLIFKHAYIYIYRERERGREEESLCVRERDEERRREEQCVRERERKRGQKGSSARPRRAMTPVARPSQGSCAAVWLARPGGGGVGVVMRRTEKTAGHSFPVTQRRSRIGS